MQSVQTSIDKPADSGMFYSQPFNDDNMSELSTRLPLRLYLDPCCVWTSHDKSACTSDKTYDKDIRRAVYSLSEPRSLQLMVPSVAETLAIAYIAGCERFCNICAGNSTDAASSEVVVPNTASVQMWASVSTCLLTYCHVAVLQSSCWCSHQHCPPMIQNLLLTLEFVKV